MQIELITNVAKSERFAPNWTDRAWLIMENAESAAMAAGNAACLLIGTDATTFTDSGGTTRTAGYEASQPDAAGADLAPLHLLLGAWHDTPAAGARGKVQCSGWDNDVLVTQGTAAPVQGAELIAATTSYALVDAGAVAGANASGALATLVERAANIGTSGTANLAVWWRAL